MKKFLLTTAFLLFSPQAFAVAGFGISASQGLFSVGEKTTPVLIDNPAGDDPLNVGSFTNHGFQNGIGGGGYVYIDAIPFIDIDIEGNFLLSSYEFSFNNEVSSIDNVSFGWSAFTGYATLQKSLFQLKIPFLAKAKLFAGAGANQHYSTPLISQEMLEEVITDGNLQSGELSEEDLLNYLNENKISATGAHIQAGLQFKLLAFDSFIYYRHVVVKDVIPDSNNFGSINFRLGLGI